MNKHPRIRHQGHHLSIRTTLWKTYIVCEECGEEYETAWNMLYQRIGHRILRLLGIIFVGILFLLSGPSTVTTWYICLLFVTAYVAFICILRIGLNALQAFLLRHSDNLASHIF